MAKNILIFSDGTGQRGGVTFDERRSNVYKLYRATRCGPDSAIDPSEQLAFYDPGLGTAPGGLTSIGRFYRLIYNFVSQATGFGITRNIIECYAAIVRLWQPGDRIFLFGFSRGAYTVRCLGGVLSLCGVPTRMKDGTPLKRDEATSKKIARLAVKKVYQHTASKKEEDATPHEREYLKQRRALGRQFQRDFGSAEDGASNAIPHFFGVFDTVASLSNKGSLILLVLLALVLAALIAGALALVWPPFWFWLVAVLAAFGLLALSFYLATNVKVAFNLEGHKWWRTLHLTHGRMRFYDRDLNPKVGYARHALAIDENRADFQRVPWGLPKERRETGPGGPEWFQQIWFAGNHSDIGGSYPENESRLSDITLVWMLQAAESVGMKADRAVLHLYPDPAGPQHDESRSIVFRYARKLTRTVPADAPLHPTVLARFRSTEVMQHDLMQPYRPEALRKHNDVASFY